MKFSALVTFLVSFTHLNISLTTPTNDFVLQKDTGRIQFYTWFNTDKKIKECAFITLWTRTTIIIYVLLPLYRVPFRAKCVRDERFFLYYWILIKVRKTSQSQRFRFEYSWDYFIILCKIENFESIKEFGSELSSFSNIPKQGVQPSARKIDLSSWNQFRLPGLWKKFEVPRND